MTENQHEIGYEFHNRLPTMHGAYHTLDVYIRDRPTLRHFDPEEMDMLVQSTEEPLHRAGVERIVIHYPWPGKEKYRTVMGRVIIQDRVGKKVECFTFGSDLKVHTEPGLTHSRLQSDAPIFDLTQSDLPGVMLVSEVETILAAIRAHSLEQVPLIERRLAELDSISIYAASLVSLERRFNAFKHKELMSFQKLHQAVSAEIRRIKEDGSWPDKEVVLDELLLGGDFGLVLA